MKFKIGDKVNFLDEKGGGIIAKILSKTTLLVQIEDGFEIPFNINELLMVENKAIIKKPVDQTNKEIIQHPPFTRKDTRVKKINKKVELEKEVDLHIEELLDDTRGLRNGEKLEIQLNHFQKELEKAILNKQTRKIIFIHGVGSGKLKQEIYKILKTYDNIRFHDASYQKYGFGATEVLV